MAGRGYVKLFREAMDHEVFQDEWLWKLFCWCILKANFRAASYRGTPIPRGSFVMGRINAAQELHVSPSRVYRGLSKLQDMGCVVLKSNSNWTAVTICNYATYQSFDDDDRTADERLSEQPADTIEETNNPRNQPSTPLPPPPATSLDADGRVDGFSWTEVMTRLAAIGVVNAKQACTAAKDGCRCSPDHAMKLIDYAQANGKGPGALVWRFNRAVSSMPIEAGWPANPEEEQAAMAKAQKATAKQRAAEAETLANQIIKSGRRDKKTDDEIRAMLAEKGVEWPK